MVEDGSKSRVNWCFLSNLRTQITMLRACRHMPPATSKLSCIPKIQSSSIWILPQSFDRYVTEEQNSRQAGVLPHQKFSGLEKEGGCLKAAEMAILLQAQQPSNHHGRGLGRPQRLGASRRCRFGSWSWDSGSGPTSKAQF